MKHGGGCITESLAPVWSWSIFQDCIRAFDSMIPSDRLSAILLPLVAFIYLVPILPLMLLEMWYRYGKMLQEIKS